MNWKQIGWSVVAALIFLVGVHQAVGLKNAFPLDVLLLIYSPCILMALYLHLRQIEHWPVVLEATGISVGIFVSILWFVHLALSDPTISQIFSAMSRSFMAVLHGGVVSAVGYFFASDVQHPSRARQKADYAVAIAIVVLVLVLEVWFSEIDPSTAYVDMRSMLVFCAPLFLLLALGRDQINSDKILRAVVVGMLGPVLLSIVVYTASANDITAIGPAMALGVLALLYGGLCLFMFGCVMPSTPQNRKALWRANWHALEIYALVILILFAPPSIMEIAY